MMYHLRDVLIDLDQIDRYAIAVTEEFRMWS